MIVARIELVVTVASVKKQLFPKSYLVASKSPPLPAAGESPNPILIKVFISEKILCQKHGSLINKILCG